MVKRSWTSIWAKGLARSMTAMRKAAKPASKRAKRTGAASTKRKAGKAVARQPAALSRAHAHDHAPDKKSPGHWLPGVALGPAGARRYKLYRPSGLQAGERVPMLVMLHGCGQDAKGFAASTRMNQIAARERFIVLYPEQDRLANPQGCWN